jgi:hypothetical protein
MSWCAGGAREASKDGVSKGGEASLLAHEYLETADQPRAACAAPPLAWLYLRRIISI